MRKALPVAALLAAISIGTVLAAPSLLSTGSRGLRTQPPQLSAAHPPAPGNPFSEHVLPAAERRWVRGSVTTRLEAGSYTYLRLREANGAESWLVSLAISMPRQDRVRALVLGRADHFHSRRLDRDFSPLLFAAVRGDAP